MLKHFLGRKNHYKRLLEIAGVFTLTLFLQVASASYGKVGSEHSYSLENTTPDIQLQDIDAAHGLTTGSLFDRTWILSRIDSIRTSSNAPDHGQLGAYCTSNAHCIYGLICLNQTCSYCSTTSQCQDIQLLCDTSTHQCAHKPLTDFTWRDGLTFVLVFIIAGLSNAGGVGGGFLFVPVLVLATGYRARTAAAISQALVTGASGANTFYGLIRRHPKRERPRIDYGVVIHFIPSVLCGTSIGVLLNELFPNFFTLFALSALVLYVFYVSLKKGIHLWKQERKEAAEAKKKDEANKEQNKGKQDNVETKPAQEQQSNGSSSHQVTEGAEDMQPQAPSSQENGVCLDQADMSLEVVDNDVSDMAGDIDPQTSERPKHHQSSDDIVSNKEETNSEEKEKDFHSKEILNESQVIAAQKDLEGSEKPDTVIPVGTDQEDSAELSWKERMLVSWSHVEQRVLSVLDRIPFLGKFIDPARYLKNSDDILQYEKRQYPLDCILYVIIIFAFLVVFSLLRGGHSPRSLAGIPLCSAGYAVVYVIQEVGLVLFTLFAGIRNVRMQTLKERVGYPFYAKDFMWTKVRVIYFSPLMIVLGAIGAWVGAGGSFMSTPILVAGIGMDPVVVQSTAGFMNFTSGLSSALQYIFDHQMKIDYGLSLGACTLVGSFTGLYILNGLVARYNLQAILVIVMSIVMFGAFVVDLYAGVRELIGVLDLNEHFPITSICAAS